MRRPIVHVRNGDSRPWIAGVNHFPSANADSDVVNPSIRSIEDKVARPCRTNADRLAGTRLGTGSPRQADSMVAEYGLDEK